MTREIVDGRFELLEAIGKGGMGIVYRALDRERGVQVALKTLRGITPDRVLRFKTEFRALRDVRHANLVELGELFESNGTWYFTMELIRGVRFLDWVYGEQVPDDIRTSGPTAASHGHGDTISNEPDTVASAPDSVIRRARSIPDDRGPADRLASPRCDETRLRGALAGLVRGLAALHAAGVVHRDVKPSNVLVDDSGRAVLLDFGVVAELSAPQVGIVVGTINFMAPEQARGEPVEPAADWYAVGVLAFQALTGRLPYDGTDDDVLAAKQGRVAPSPSELADGVPADLERLCRGLLERDPARRPRPPEILDILGVELGADQPWTPRNIEGQLFVGRGAELAALDDALATSRRRAVCAVVEGESGVGKTALVAHFVELARADEPRLVVLRGRCHERERVPYNAIDGVIDDLARFLMARSEAAVSRVVPDGAAQLLAVFPALRAVPRLVDAAAAADPARAPGNLRGRAFAALRELVYRLGSRRPIVIAIDDLQWADGDSLAVLDELLAAGDAAPPMPACIVATLRPGPTADRFTTAAAADVVRIALAGLGDGDAEELVRRIDHAGATTRDAAQIVAESRGHPMFLRELVWQRTVGAGAQPVRLDQAIRTRAARHPDAARRLLAVVAVAGSPIPRRVALAVAALTAADAEPHLGAVVHDHLLRVHGPRPEDAIEPFHDRVAEAIRGELSPDTVRDIHRGLARTLEAIAAPADVLLLHFEAAGDPDRAAHYVVAAADAALAAFAFGRAAELYRRALERDLPSLQRVELLVRLADALGNDGRAAEAARCFIEAAGLEAPDSDRQLDLLRRAAEKFLMSGQLRPGLDTARAVLARVDMVLPSTRARAIAGIVWNQLRTGRRALTWGPRPADAAGSLRADICWSIGAGLAMVDTLLGAYFSGRAARLALAHGDPRQISRALSTATVGAAALGRRHRAVALLDAARRAAAADGTPIARWYAELAAAATTFLLDNDFQRCFEVAGQLEREWYALGRGPGWETDVVMHFSFASQQFLGQYAAMAQRVAARIHDARRTGDLFQEVTLRVRFAIRHLLVGRPDVARDDVLGALAAWEPSVDGFGNQRAWALWSRTRIAMYAGDLDAVERDLDAEWHRMQRALVGRVRILRLEWYYTYGVFLVGRAIVASRRERHREAAALLRRAAGFADRLARLRYPVAPAPVMALRAAIALARGGDVVPALRAAADDSLARGMLPVAPFLRRRLGEALGGSEGINMIVEADTAARGYGFVDPERAAEIFFPSGRFYD